LSFHFFAILFFTVLLAVFYAIAYSVIAGILQNYTRYYQKADLQWTGPAGDAPKRKSRAVNLIILLAVSFASAWIVVNFLVMR